MTERLTGEQEVVSANWFAEPFLLLLLGRLQETFDKDSSKYIGRQETGRAR